MSAAPAAALRRAARVSAAACTGFYVCRYVLGDVTTAVYAVFSAIALGALSEVAGRPAQRTRTYAAALLVGGVLVSLGTLLAVSTWTAAAGMLVVGSAIAYAGVGGPRTAGVASGLQLFYVLPCFPPYAPDTLDQRLLGLAVGVTLLIIADRVLWPAPAPADPAVRVADAAGRVAASAAQLAGQLRAGDPSGPSGSWADAAAAVEDLRWSNVPIAERPLGPGVRDRCLVRAAAAIGVTAERLRVLADLWGGPGRRAAHPAAAELVAVVGDVLAAARAALLGTGPPPTTERLDTALDAFRRRREQALLDPAAPPPSLRAGVAAAAVAVAARGLVLTVRGAVGAPAPDPSRTPADLWFLSASPVQLWERRARAHLTRHSVYLQNAVRLGLGLALARGLAGVLDLSHGFWVLLATLSLMRTSAVADRAVFVRALVGTTVGAVAAGAVLVLVGGDTVVYAWALPGSMLVAFAAGPLFGVAAGQACFTVVVALLFAQVAPVDWRIAEVRLIDVLVGGLVGIVTGAAVWPRGGRGEMVRATAEGLRAGAAEVVAVVGQLTGGGPAPPTSLGRVAALLDHTYAQYRSEPAPPGPQPSWLPVLGVVHRIDDYSRTLRSRYPPAAPPPWPRLAHHLRDAATDVAAAYREAAVAVATGARPRARPAVRLDPVPRHELAAAPDDALRMLDTWGWLATLADDLTAVDRALAPPPAGGGPAPGTRPLPARSSTAASPR